MDTSSSILDRVTSTQVLLLLSGVSIIYTAYLALTRLVLSPIAKFPGPKLAAFTFWYEFYYDVVQGGRYTWKIGELHERYGWPITVHPGTAC
jgi:hypothetical protein